MDVDLILVNSFFPKKFFLIFLYFATKKKNIPPQRLEFEELNEIKSVCKTFYFILKEDQKFWKLYCERILQQTTLPKEYEDWKRYFIESYLIGWDQSKFENTNFVLDQNNKKIITSTKSNNWLCAKSKMYLIENHLYRFKIIDLST
jgi:hypothetical protein